MERSRIMQLVVGIIIGIAIVGIASLVAQDMEMAIMMCAGMSFPFAILVWFVAMKG